MEIKRITTNKEFYENMAFLLAALATCPFAVSAGAALADISDEISNPNTGVFIASEGKYQVGVVICQNNTSAFQRGVQLTHLYTSEPGYANKLIETVHAFATERKAKRVWGVDINKRPEAHERLFRKWEPQPEGTFYSYEVK